MRERGVPEEDDFISGVEKIQHRVNDFSPMADG
jgi:hypothetical protein